MSRASYRQAHEDWQIRKYRTLERTKHLLETGLYADCEFLVGADESDKEAIKAHKIFLAMSSPVFDAMFFGTMTQSAENGQNELIALPDLAPSSFKDLLKHIYADSLDLQSMNQAMGLYYAAQKYILPEVVAKCLQYVKENLCPANICKVLEFSKLCDDEQLQSKCLLIFRERTQECLKLLDFEDLSKSTLLSVVKDKSLNIRELELFDAVVRWAENQCTRSDLEVNGTNMREVLSEIINEIRFLSMTPKEFASSPALSGILTKEECLAILMNLNNPGSWCLPIQLSSNRTQRGRASSTFSGTGTIKHGGILCLRRLENEKYVEKLFVESLTTLAVNQNVDIKGIVLAEMDFADEELRYVLPDKLIGCKLLDSDGAVLKCFTPSKIVTNGHSITFDPVPKSSSCHLKRNNTYRICVSALIGQRVGFLSGTASSDVVYCQGVKFTFRSRELHRDGLVRGLIFSVL